MLHVSAADAAHQSCSFCSCPRCHCSCLCLCRCCCCCCCCCCPLTALTAPAAPLMLPLPPLQLPMQLAVTACVVNFFATLICSRDKRYISTIYLLLFSMLAAMPLSLQPCRCCGMSTAVCCRSASAAVASPSPLSASVRQLEKSYSAARAGPRVVGSRVSIGREMKHLPADRSIRGTPIEITIELE